MYDSNFSSPRIFSDSWEDYIRPGHFDSLYTAVLDSTIVNNISLRENGPLLSTHWGQNAPWNSAMPYKDSTMTSHCYAGCVPVSAGQVLYYLHDKFNNPPTSHSYAECNKYIPANQNYITVSSSEASFYDPSYTHWEDMALNNTYNDGFDEVSALLLKLGVLYNAKYYRTGTGAATPLATTVFPEFNITCQCDTILNINQLVGVCDMDIYDQNLPLIMSIVDTTYGGHAVVIDGYKYSHDEVTSYFTLYDANQQPVFNYISIPTTEESHFVTINWGWNGAYDSTSQNVCWYNLFTDWIVSYYNFSYKRYIVHNFES